MLADIDDIRTAKWDEIVLYHELVLLRLPCKERDCKATYEYRNKYNLHLKTFFTIYVSL